MSKINIAILSMIAVLLSGCISGQPSTSMPIKEEQTKGVYKIYYPKYFMYDAKMLNALLDVWCKDDACRQNAKNKPAKVVYVHMLSSNKCKMLHSTIKDDEAAEILKLEQQKEKNCSFINDMLGGSWRYKPNTSLVWFMRNKNGDFIDSEFLTLQNGKVVDRKLIESTKATTLYDKNGNKLLDRAHEDIYFYSQTCDKVLAIDGLKYEILPIDVKKDINTPQIATNKDIEKLLKTKFYLDNKNSSKIKIFAPFGYVIEFGEKFIATIKKVKIYGLFDENGKNIFDNRYLVGILTINNHRLIVHTIKPNTRTIEAFLYDFDNKKVLLAAEWIEPGYKLYVTKYDKITFFKDNKSGIADFNGNIVIDLQDKYSFKNTYKGFIAYADGTGIYKGGVLDMELNPIMKDLSKVDFRDDVFIAHAKDRIVVFDYSKNILQDLKADDIAVYNDFYVASLKNEGILYDKKWNKLFDKPYKNLKPLDNNIFSYMFDGKTALMDINTKEIIPSVCDSIKLGQCGVIECINSNNKN
jgi:hypothetical protein